MRRTLLVALLFALPVSLCAQAPTWSQDVAAIVYNRCATCHHTGGIAPFNLMSYNDAVSFAGEIKPAVETGKMPPWPPDPTYSHMAHERVLSATERTKILTWLNSGRPSGDMSLAPPAPVFSNNGDLPGVPDLIVRIPTYTSPAATGDMYRCFVLPTGQSADKYITAFEAIPGNRSIVHHVLVYADTTGVATMLDAADPGPGYTSFGGIGTDKAILLGGWVPGTSPMKYPPNFGSRLPKGARLVLQIHYPAGSAGMKDSTEVHFFFSPTNTMRDVFILPALNHGLNISSPLVIPANKVKSFTEQIEVPFNISLLGVAPHMHLLGQNITCFGVKPNGDTQRYISVPKWDFHWQGFYLLRQVMKLEAGTTAYARATFDNTSANPNNPSNPPVLVSAGESTTDEMMLVYFVFAEYQPGDEHILIDQTVTPTSVSFPKPYYGAVDLLQPYPVPASDRLVIKYYLDEARTGSIGIISATGQKVMQIKADQQLAKGYTALPVDVSQLAAGSYTIRLSTGGIVKSHQILIRR